jgi:hypothetical protein
MIEGEICHQRQQQQQRVPLRGTASKGEDAIEREGKRETLSPSLDFGEKSILSFFHTSFLEGRYGVIRELLGALYVRLWFNPLHDFPFSSALIQQLLGQLYVTSRRGFALLVY